MGRESHAAAKTPEIFSRNMYFYCPPIDIGGQVGLELMVETTGGFMRNRDIVSSLVWLGVGIVFLIGGLHAGLFRRGIPGPGLLPFIVALSLMALSLMVFFPALTGKKEEASGVAENFFPERDSFKKIFFGLIALFLYGVALEYIGYIATTFIFLLFTSRLMERAKWQTPLILAISTAILSYLLFVVLLEVQLPRGVLGT
ncbi:MAG: tripartite tricarboxylate transporter TctB family protein [Deltaproteobacteria bacterium]|nr:tripartite tricarboxylate transporter TctB family protein [Deltaproteobacteria bacterium]